MDLAILHALESFREGAGAFLNGFLTKMTELGAPQLVMVVIAAIYWCCSKRFGTYLMLGYYWNRLVNGFLKITACAYRPWIRDATLIPDPDALPAATGYSFPSGHSMNAASLFGGLGVCNGLKKSLRAAGFVVMALIAFSRIYLCVHTPQDILVGAVAGCLVMFCAWRLLPKIESAKNGDLIVAGISLAIAVAVAVYATIKSYPVDYDAEGKIIVDGAKMRVDTYKGVGWNAGFFIGWIIERRFVGFSAEGTLPQRALRLICGLVGYYFVNLALCPLIQNGIGGTFGIILSCFTQVLYIVLIYPLFVRAVQKRRKAS